MGRCRMGLDRLTHHRPARRAKAGQEKIMSSYSYSSADLQSVLRRIPAANPFYPYHGVAVIKNEDGSISVMDNGEEAEFASVADATEYIDQLRPVELDLS